MDTVADLLLARRDDHDTALLFEDRRVTWAEHVDISRRWASSIHGMLDETSPRHVGVLLDNIPEFSYLLGAAALGGFVLVGLNSTRSAAALAEDARRTHCRFVLTNTARLGTLSAPSFDVTSADWRARMSAGPAMTPVVDELLMLVFTSGTSGDPKAVRCTHSKVAAPGHMLAERFDLGPQDTVYVSMPLFHSNAVMAGWSVALASGANLALRRTFSASEFFSDVRAFGATYANYVGTPLSYVLQTPQLPDDRDNPLRVAYGNEATPGAAAHFAERFGVRVVDGFGSSEGGVSIARTPDTPPGALGPLPDGVEIQAVDGSRCASALFDQHGALLNESDAVGELVNTSGPGMFCGYYDDPEAEADRMRHGMYYSGDLAYADVDGYAYFAGRSSGWLRVGGENLGSAPIERILLRHSGVEAVSVYGVPAAGPGDRVMAAIVASSNVMDGFADFLAAQSDLSARAYPHLVRVCTELPRTASHKILVRRLQQQSWNTDDPIWLSEGAGSEFRLLSEAERRELDKQIGSRLAR